VTGYGAVADEALVRPLSMIVFGVALTRDQAGL
jgi:hypothetical protein